MEKKNGGYSLAYVLVVVIIISLVAVSIAGVAMTNLEMQSRTNDNLMNVYEAEGEIEEFWAKLYNLVTEQTLTVAEGAEKTPEALANRIVYELKDGNLKDSHRTNEPSYVVYTTNDGEHKSGVEVYDNSVLITVFGNSADGTITVTAKIRISNISDKQYENESEVGMSGTFTVIDTMNLCYEEYVIEQNSGGDAS